MAKRKKTGSTLSRLRASLRAARAKLKTKRKTKKTMSFGRSRSRSSNRSYNGGGYNKSRSPRRSYGGGSFMKRKTRIVGMRFPSWLIWVAVLGAAWAFGKTQIMTAFSAIKAKL